MRWAEATSVVGASGPDTPRPLFSALLLFAFVVLHACGAAGGAQPGRIRLFAEGETKVPEGLGAETPTRDVRFSESPLLVAAEGVMAALTEVHYTAHGQQDVDIAARYAETGGRDWVTNVTEVNGGGWKTQLVMREEEVVEEGYLHEPRKPMAVARGGKIYLFAVVYRKNPSGMFPFGNWDVVLTVGDVKSGAQGGKTIVWRTPKSLNATVTKGIKDHSLDVFRYSGASAFFTNDGKIVLAMRAITYDGIDGTAIVHLDGEEEVLKVSFAETPAGCILSSFFEWDKKLIMAPTYCRGGSPAMQESTDMGVTWAGAGGLIARLWEFSKGKEHFATVVTRNNSVLLFTESRSTGKFPSEEHHVYLRFTDGSRVGRAGVIVSDDYPIVFNTLLNANGKLFSLHRHYGQQGKTIFFAHHKGKMRKIESVLKTWATNDAFLSKPCSETAPKGAPLGNTLCVTPMPTDGLVGFLSDKGNNTLWYDEYLFKNAWVRKGTRVTNGYTFRGAGAGAQWSVGQEYLGKLYNFGKYGFTLLATVTIHEVPKGDIPLLTVGGVEIGRRVGLWYDRDKQWRVVSEDDREATQAVGWETNKTCRVVLTLQGNNISAYVDGVSAGTFEVSSTRDTKSLDVESFFIGGYGGGASRVSHVTVTNVLLYNRPLNGVEIDALGLKTVATSMRRGHADGSLRVIAAGAPLFLLSLWFLATFV